MWLIIQSPAEAPSHSQERGFPGKVGQTVFGEQVPSPSVDQQCVDLVNQVHAGQGDGLADYVHHQGAYQSK